MNNISILGKNCCGCTACEQICPKKCIAFKENNEGFMYPVVDEAVCVNCGACTKHCPVLNPPLAENVPDVYAAKYRDSKTTAESTSGGIFIPLAKSTLENGGIVYGCAYDENLKAKHIAVETENELFRLQGSKYVQSDISGIYSRIKADLDSNRYVLFSGTGCQVAGLRSFLGREYERLVTVDIVCHGVPSPRLFERYTDYLGKKLGEPIKSYNFRSKKRHGWGLFYELETAQKAKGGSGFDDPYYNAFLNCKTYREGCYSCRFANCNRQGDITLADFWGIEYINPKFYSKNGVSLVLVNTEKGKKLWQSLDNCIESTESTLEQAVKMNKNLSEPSSRPECRSSIYDGFDGDFEKYVNQKLYVKFDIKRKIKAVVPVALKGRIKHLIKK